MLNQTNKEITNFAEKYKETIADMTKTLLEKSLFTGDEKQAIEERISGLFGNIDAIIQDAL